MSNQFHGHDVMEMMIQAKQSFTRESLKSTIVEKFGTEARFYTCSADNMDADAIIDFLDERGKFLQSDDGFKTDASKICQH